MTGAIDWQDDDRLTAGVRVLSSIQQDGQLSKSAASFTRIGKSSNQVCQAGGLFSELVEPGVRPQPSILCVPAAPSRA